MPRSLASLTIFPNKIWTLIIKIKPAKEEEKKRELWQRLDSAPTNPLTPKYEDVGVSKTQIVQLTHLAGVLCFPSQYRTNLTFWFHDSDLVWMILLTQPLVAINVGSTNMIYAARVAGAIDYWSKSYLEKIDVQLISINQVTRISVGARQASNPNCRQIMGTQSPSRVFVTLFHSFRHIFTRLTWNKFCQMTPNEMTFKIG